jgi:hypothetical protein
MKKPRLSPKLLLTSLALSLVFAAAASAGAPKSQGLPSRECDPGGRHYLLSTVGVKCPAALEVLKQAGQLAECPQPIGRRGCQSAVAVGPWICVGRMTGESGTTNCVYRERWIHFEGEHL